MGLCVVARNSSGIVLFAGTKRMRVHWLPEIAEFKAILFAATLAHMYGLVNVIIESDCQRIIKRLNRVVTYLTDLDSLLEDILVVSKKIAFVSWSHVGRDGNFIAHHLAKLVPFGTEQVWENFCRREVESFVILDNLSFNS